MGRIFILGGYGLTGKLLSRHLLEQSEAQLIIAGRNGEAADKFVGELNSQFPGDRAQAKIVDASDGKNLENTIAGSDMLVVAAPTTEYTETVVKAALAAGVDYLDVQLSTYKLDVLESYAAEIEQSARCFITEAGFHPGLPAAMVRYAAKHLDTINSAITAGYLNMGKSLPYSNAVDELMELFKDYQAQVYKNGAWTKSGSFEMSKVNFGGEIGTRQCFSMYLEEMRKLPEMYHDLRNVGFYMSSTHWIVDWIITPLAMALMKILPDSAMHPIGRVVWWGMQTFPKPPYLVMLKVNAAGEKDGMPGKFEASLSHNDGYELTAIPVAAALLQYLDGTARKPGLHMMGHLVDPGRLFRDMERMGVEVKSVLTA